MNIFTTEKVKEGVIYSIRKPSFSSLSDETPYEFSCWRDVEYKQTSQNLSPALINIGALICILGNFSCVCFRLLKFFKINFQKILLRNTFRLVSNGLDPDQDRHSVGPDLGPNCL